MPCCKAKGFGGWCGKEAVVHTDDKANDYCVFHAPDNRKGMPIVKFNELVFQRIDEYKEKNKDISIEEQSAKPCDFSGIIFEGDVIFREYGMQNCLPPIKFYNAHFIGDTDFKFARFIGDTSFMSARFDGAADFKFALFGGISNFSGTKFKGEADFWSAHFNEKVSFDSAHFGSIAYFESVDFGSEADFKFTEFKSAAHFRNSMFKQAAIFQYASIQKASFFDNTLKNIADIRHITISDELVLQNANLKYASFRNTDLTKIKFINCDFYEMEGRYQLQDEVDMEMKAFRVAHGKDTWGEDNPSKWLEDIEYLYRTMKSKSKDENDMFSYSYWHLSEKEMMLKRTELSKNPFRWLVLRLYKFTSGFGEEPLQAFGVLLLAIFGFSLLFGAVEGKSNIWGLLVNTLEYAAFVKKPIFESDNMDKMDNIIVCGHWITIGMRLLIPLQLAFFAFAMRNRFRR